MTDEGGKNARTKKKTGNIPCFARRSLDGILVVASFILIIGDLNAKAAIIVLIEVDGF